MDLCHGSYRLDLFQDDCFPSPRGHLAINQLIFFFQYSQITKIIPLMGESSHSYQHVRVGLLKDSSLMGTFSLPPPKIPIRLPLLI